MTIHLLCSVRGCREPLVRLERALVCPRRHFFDVARSGYCNLLQPQDRRSSAPGDSRGAVAARRRLTDAGHGDWLLSEVRAELALLGRRGSGARTVLDVGCGEGFVLGSLAREERVEAHGLDVSVFAIDLAAKKYPGVNWVVANADRFLPWPDGSFDLVTSMTARSSPGEMRRVLAKRGRALIAVPGEDDAIELREALLGRATRRPRGSRVVHELEGHLELVSRRTVRRSVFLDRAGIRDLLTAMYRGGRARERERIDAIAPLDVTMSREILVFGLGSRDD